MIGDWVAWKPERIPQAIVTNSNKLRTYSVARYYKDAEILYIISGKEGC